MTDADVDFYEEELGQTVQLLMDRGNTQAAALLLDCRILRFDHIDLLFSLPPDDSPGKGSTTCSSPRSIMPWMAVAPCPQRRTGGLASLTGSADQVDARARHDRALEGAVVGVPYGSGGTAYVDLAA